MKRPAYPFCFSICLLALAWVGSARASSCCGGGVGAPVLLTGDDRSHVRLSYSHAEVSTDVSTKGLWRKREYFESSNKYGLEAAHIFFDRWQVGGGVPLVSKSRGVEESSGMGDVSLTLGYEVLPDWDYNPLRPKVLIYLMTVVPTGRGLGESRDPVSLDVTGRGEWALGVGSLMSKVWAPLDALCHFEIRRGMGSENGKPSGSVILGSGYNFGSHRLGAEMGWVYEEPVINEGSEAPSRWGWGGVSFSTLISGAWSLTLAYQDQTLVGRPANAALERSLSFSLRRGWVR